MKVGVVEPLKNFEFTAISTREVKTITVIIEEYSNVTEITGIAE